MKFDDVLEHIGGFGLYQKWVFFLTLPPNLLAGFFMLNPVFLLGTPLHRCALPNYDNDTYDIQSAYHEELINKTIPLSDLDSETYDRCRLNDFVDKPGTNGNNSQQDNNVSVSEVTCDRWVYDKSVFKETFVTKMDLVCEKEIWMANAEMLLYFGMLVGSLASGILADRYGRKPVMYVSILLMTGSSNALAWADSYALFVVLQFVLGAATIGMFMPAYIISLEITSVRKRLWPGVIADFPYVLGLILYAAIAYALRDWFWIELVTSLPGVLFVTYWWLMPESPRWLLSKGRVLEAEKIIRKAARWNGAKLPEKAFDRETIAESSKRERSESFLHLFSSKTMCVRSLLIFFNWTVVAFAYFGLSLNTDNLNGNVYINFGLAGLVEIPANFIVIGLVDKIGRCRLYFITMIVGGASCISTLLAIEYAKDVTSLPVVLAMVGKLGVTAGYSVQYIHSAELFPTVLRNAGMGCASLFARVGTMVAPYVVNLGENIGGSLGEAFPLIVFGGMAFLSAILSLALPETLNKNLPETVKDGENFGKSGAFYFVQSFRLGDEYERLRDDAPNCEMSTEETYEALRR